MIEITYIDELSDEVLKILDEEFDKYANKRGVECDYKCFNFVAKDGEKIVGLITGHSYYDEVHIGNLIILEEYRNQHIGSQLLNSVEKFFSNKRFKNINLTTYGFQAPEFYKKCGYEIEFVRENKDNPKLNKYFFIKYI